MACVSKGVWDISSSLIALLPVPETDSEWPSLQKEYGTFPAHSFVPGCLSRAR